MNVKKILKISAILILFLIIAAIITIRLIYGGGEYYKDLSTTPILSDSTLKTVAVLNEPPGNIAVSNSGRIFFTIHPESRPEFIKLEELIDGKSFPYPDSASQKLFETPLGVVVDRQNRLWVIDHGTHGFGDPKLLAFDLNDNKLIFRYDFPPSIVSRGDFVQDIQVSPNGNYIYIADVSFFAKNPAIIVFNVKKKKARRVLQDDPSVSSQNWIINSKGRKMTFFGGLIALKAGVDGIALEPNGKWLYYAAMNHSTLYRIQTKYLNDENLSDNQLRKHIETVGKKPLSDGLSSDSVGNIYITDVEHGAIMIKNVNSGLQTLIKSKKLRWPDGLSFGPNGWLYISDSDIPDIMMRSKDHIKENAPYFLFKFKPMHAGAAGQ